MNIYKMLVLASILFPGLIHAMHNSPQKHDSRAAHHAAQFGTPTKKSKKRKITRAQNAVAFDCIRKRHQQQTSQHIIQEATGDFTLPAAARGTV